MNAQRMFFLIVATLLTVGIWLSGWEHVHWLIYVIVGMLSFAFLTGICPGLVILKKLGFK